MNRNRTSSLALLLMLSLAGCINLPGIDPEQPATPDVEDPLPDLSVRIQSPATKTYTNSAIDVSVEVTNGTAEAVDLFAGDELLATLTGPYTYHWDTTSKPEGSYTLTAKARRGAQTFASEAREVVVDRTPPQVTLRTPSPGAQDVYVRQPIQVTFSEPLDPMFLSDSTVRLLMQLAGPPVELAKALSLSADGVELTLVPNAKPSIPSKLTVELGALRDRAGNILDPVTGWSWELPGYLVVGGALGAPALALKSSVVVDGQGRPIVAWAESNSFSGALDVHVRRWSGSEWEGLGGKIDTNPAFTHVVGLALGIDAEGPILALIERIDEATNGVHVRRWTGNSWQSLGSVLVTSRYSGWLALAVNGVGGIAVAWADYDGTPSAFAAYARRWNGNDWDVVGPSLSASSGQTDVSNIKLQLGIGGQPIMAWSESDGVAKSVYVQRWTGTTWESIGGALSASTGDTPVSGLDLQVDSSGQSVVAWTESDGSTSNIYVRRWSGSQWEAIGGALSASAGDTPARDPVLIINQSGFPIVSWIESDGSETGVHVSQWNGASWTPWGPMLDAKPGSSAYSHSLGQDSSGDMFISWIELAENSLPLNVRQLNN